MVKFKINKNKKQIHLIKFAKNQKKKKIKILSSMIFNLVKRKILILFRIFEKQY